jgi:hypothetical protein
MSLKLLRAVAMLSSTVLFLPFVSILFLTFECDADGEWTVNSQLTCYSGIHIAFVVVVTLLLPYFILLSVLIAGVFFDRNLKSDSVNAQIHGKLTRLHQTIERVLLRRKPSAGRGEMLMLSIKVVLSLSFGLFSHSIDPWILQVILLGSSLTYLYIYLVQMPFINFRVNEVKATAAGAYFGGCLGTSALQQRSIQESRYRRCILVSLQCH